MDWRRSLRYGRTSTVLTGALLILSLLAVPSRSALAQTEGFDIQQFTVQPSQFTNYFRLAGAIPLESGQWELGLLYHYANDPLVLQDSNGDRIASLIPSQHVLNILGAFGVGWFFDFGFNVPLIVSQEMEDQGRIPLPGDFGSGSFGVGDIVLTPRFRFYTTHTEDSPGGTAMGILVNTFLPTGDPDRFQGEGFRIEPRLLFDAHHSGGSRFSLNVGYMYRQAQEIQGAEVNHMLTYGMAADFVAGKMFHIIPELAGGAVLAADEINKEEAPLEFILGFKIFPIEIMMIELGGGVGILEGPGIPDWRVFLGVHFSVIPERDNDHDGIPNNVDQCPDDPEDFDGFEDDDGCPDPDNDEDGILDVYDQCPNEPEDFDGFEDEDGCPDPDNDGDGILDVDDLCPLDAEDMDGWEDDDGCPDFDNDGDGILDVDDQCPNEPEDFDGFEDDDGCPDPDNDGDTILDIHDQCPNEPETWNGFEDDDGCPDEGLIVLTCEEIRIMERVYFETDSDVIQRRSFNLLNTVAAVMIARPDLTLIRVEGHTDDRGSDSYNLDLSQRRAQSVTNYLIDQGVPASRLLPVGYGEQYPIADNRSRDGRAENRRVQFRIIDQEGCPETAPPPY